MQPTTQTQAVAAPRKVAIAVGDRGIKLQTFDDLWSFAQIVVKSKLAPKGVDTIEAVCIALQSGLEIGFTPMQSLRAFAVINGRPTIYGDAGTAKVMESGLLIGREETWEGTPGTDDYTAICRLKRRGLDFWIVGTFSVADAKRARLWGKQGPWTEYTQRQQMWRARTYAYRDGFADVLCGLTFAEEAADLPREPEYEVRENPLAAAVTAALVAPVEVTPQAEAAPTEPWSEPAASPLAKEATAEAAPERRAEPDPNDGPIGAGQLKALNGLVAQGRVKLDELSACVAGYGKHTLRELTIKEAAEIQHAIGSGTLAARLAGAE